MADANVGEPIGAKGSRLVVTAPDYEAALAFYRDVLAARAGARVIAEPVITPWNSRNARREGPAGLQPTLFEEPGEG